MTQQPVYMLVSLFSSHLLYIISHSFLILCLLNDSQRKQSGHKTRLHHHIQMLCELFACPDTIQTLLKEKLLNGPFSNSQYSYILIFGKSYILFHFSCRCSVKDSSSFHNFLFDLLYRARILDQFYQGQLFKHGIVES